VLDLEIQRELVRKISRRYADRLLLQEVEMAMKHFVYVGLLVECWECSLWVNGEMWMSFLSWGAGRWKATAQLEGHY